MAKKKTTKKNKTYNALVYVEDASTKVRTFSTKEAMGKFMDTFLKEHPDYADKYSDDWLDFAITDISGDITFFTDGMKVES